MEVFKFNSVVEKDLRIVTGFSGCLHQSIV